MSGYDYPPVATAPPIEPGPLPSTQQGWPRVIGIMSIVIGSLGVLIHGCQGFWGFMFRSFTSGAVTAQSDQGVQSTSQVIDAMGAWVIAGAVLSIVSVFVSAWLLIAGVMLVQQKRSAFRLHIWWAWTRIATAIVVAAVMIGTQVATAKAMEAAMISAGASGGGAGAPPPGMMTGVMVGAGVLGAVFYLAFFAAYPIVVLCMMRRARVETATVGWDR